MTQRKRLWPISILWEKRRWLYLHPRSAPFLDGPFSDVWPPGSYRLWGFAGPSPERKE